jgi:hypothetical protein
VSHIFKLFAAASLIAFLYAPSPGRAADAGYQSLPPQAVASSVRAQRHARRVHPRASRNVYPGDWGVLYPYRTYWDRYADWNRFEGRYYHGRYAYRAEPFPDGFWWW